MQRIWSESRLVTVSEDAEFVGALAGLLDPLHRLQIFDSVAIQSIPNEDFSDALIVWDLDCADERRLESFLQSNPGILRTCSLFLVGCEQQVQKSLKLTQEGAVDFVLKPVRPTELRTRLILARRPWVRAMRTTFDFIEALNADFTIMEQKILLVFLASPDFSASRKEINQYLWSTMLVHSNTLDVHLFNIRRKIEPNGLEISFYGKKGRWILSSKNTNKEQQNETSSSAQAKGGMK